MARLGSSTSPVLAAFLAAVSMDLTLWIRADAGLVVPRISMGTLTGEFSDRWSSTSTVMAIPFPWL